MQMCEEFKKHDKYHRGMITAASFSRSLEALGLRFGNDEVTDILRFCTITEDGYVHYKDLITHTSPELPKAKIMTPHTVFPSTVDYIMVDSDEEVDAIDAHNPAATREFISQKTTSIQRLYSRWDRGLIGTEAFVDGLKSLHIPLSGEFVKMMQIHGPSRNLGFAQLMSSLQIDDFMYRKARQPVMSPLTTDRSSKVSRQSLMRNPVTWTQHDGSNSFRVPTHRSATVPEHNMEPGEKRDRAQKMICDFCDGITNSTVFVAQLEALDVPMSMEIRRLIRIHEIGNNTQFKDFASHILKDMCDEEPPATNTFPRFDIPSKRTYSPITARSCANPDNTGRSVPYATGQAKSPVVPRIPLNGKALDESSVGDEAAFTPRQMSPQSLGTAMFPRSVDKAGSMSQRTERTSYSNADPVGGARYSIDSYSKEMAAVSADRTPIDSGAIYGHGKIVENAKPFPLSRGHQGLITRGSGDIIGWNMPAEEKARPSTAQSLCRDSGNIIGWYRGDSEDIEQPRKPRAGKACFEAQKVFRAPFGTDKDVGQVYRKRLG